MKLKTKFQDEDFDLGEVVEAGIYHGGHGRIKLITKAARGGEHTFYFESLKGLNDLFEDYEEPKEHWCITMYGGITRIKDDEEPIDDLIEIGNYFNSKEDAYDALDKLKAWKRLKDKGFRFIGIAGLKSEIHFCADEKYDNAHIMFDEYGSSSDDLKQYNKDLDLLFGGGE